jgi:hypothetical protein
MTNLHYISFSGVKNLIAVVFFKLEVKTNISTYIYKQELQNTWELAFSGFVHINMHCLCMKKWLCFGEKNLKVSSPLV